jgi:hypothetical protein
MASEAECLLPTQSRHSDPVCPMGKAEVGTTRIVSARSAEAATRIGRKRDLAFSSSAALATAAASRVASLLNGRPDAGGARHQGRHP